MEAPVIALNSNLLRLVELGLGELHGTEVDWMPSAAARELHEKVRLARSVLSSRSWVESAGRVLADPDRSAKETPSDGGSRPGGQVDVRLNAEMLQVAVDALTAFLDRKNPTPDRFNEGKLVDPPETVKAAMRVFVTALEATRIAQRLPDMEQRLLES